MAKKYKSFVKKLSALMTISFGVSMIIGGWTFIQNQIINKPTKEYIVEVNGSKIYKEDFERELHKLTSASQTLFVQKKQQLAQMGVDTTNYQGLPENILKEYLIKALIEREILLTSAKDLKIKVSNGDVNKLFEERQKEAGGKDAFLGMLTQSGYNVTTYKDVLREELLSKKIHEKIQSTSPVTDEELKKVYERYKYQNFEGQSFEEAKPQISEILKTENSSMLVNSYVAKALEKANIKFVQDEYKKLYEDSKIAIAEKEGYKFTKANLNENVISTYFSTQEGYSDKLVENIKANYQLTLNKLVEIMNKAKAAGIKVKPEFYGLDQLSDYSKKYFNYLIDTYKPSEAAMLEKFNTNRNNYNTKNTIAGYVIGQEYKASAKDFEATKKQADEVMKTVNKDNFAAKAKEISQDPGSKANGGSLGEKIDLTQLVPEFAEAVKNGKVGEIVGPVKTEFGYHIIYIQEKEENSNLAKVSHILLRPTISEETKKETLNRLIELKNEIASKKVTWEQVNTQEKYNFDIKEHFKKLSKSDFIPGIGTDTELIEKLFASKVGDIIEHQADFGVVLLAKVSEIPFKEVTFDEVKERIRLEFAIEHANKELGNIQ